MDWGQAGLLAAVGVVAGVINTMAGGGSLLSLPALIFAGLPPQVANATNRVGVLLQAGAASWRFARGGALEWREVAALLPWAMAGASAGAWISVELPEEVMRRAIGVVMLVMLALMWWRPERWLEERAAAPGPPTWSARLGMLLTGAYGGFVQAGVGVLLLAGLVLLRGQSLTRANALKVALVGGLTVPPLIIYVAHDLVAWAPGLALAAGSTAGGWLGARLSLSWGPKVVRWVVLAVVVVSSARLLGLW